MGGGVAGGRGTSLSRSEVPGHGEPGSGHLPCADHEIHEGLRAHLRGTAVWDPPPSSAGRALLTPPAQ